MTEKKQCFYEVLELQKESTPEEIKTAYKKFALKYHPDKNRDKPEEAKMKFQEISEAYTVLSDPEKRATYDKYGTIDEDEIGFDYDNFMQEFDVGDFGHFMSMMMGDMFFTQFDTFTHSGNGRKKKYQKKRQNNDPFSNMFNIKFSTAPTVTKKKQEDEEWETDSEDESKKKKEGEEEWTDEDDDEDDDEEMDEEQENKGEQGSEKVVQGGEKKPQQKGKKAETLNMNDFIQFGMMDPFSMMMGMGFGGEEAMELMAIQEFTAKNVKMLKKDRVLCKLCDEEMGEDDIQEHFEIDHEEEFEEFQKDYLKNNSNKNKNKKKK